MRVPNIWMLAPGLALAGGATLVASESPDPHRLLAAALIGIGVLITWGAALAARRQNANRPLWILLCVLAGAHAMHPLVLSANPLLFTLGRASRWGVEILLMWVMLAFPTGRLATWRERAIVISGGLAVAMLWVPGMIFSPRVPLPGAFVTCGAQCAENLLFVADRPQLAAAFLASFRTVGVLLLAATSVHLFLRLRRASPLMRRALLPVLLASIVRALFIAAFLATGVGLIYWVWTFWAVPADAAVLITQLFSSLTFWAVPLAIVWGTLRGRLYTARALERLVTGLRRRPGPGDLRIVMAEALDDPELQIGYWDDAKGCWVDALQRQVALPTRHAGDKTARVLYDADGRPVSALIHDRALLEEPQLLDAVVSSMQGALFSHQAEMALAGRHAEAASVVEHERRRIERDLHDGAQQRLLALRMKLGVSKRMLEHDTRRAEALLTEMDSDIGAAIAELRALAHGVVPPLLTERGLAVALADAASHAAIPVALDLQDVGRANAVVERAVYFCCVEALQNAAKHAGNEATARMVLRRDADAIFFSVEDNGQGLAQNPPLAVGQGLRNIRERLLAVGAHLEIGPSPTSGLRISATVPDVA